MKIVVEQIETGDGGGYGFGAIYYSMFANDSPIVPDEHPHRYFTWSDDYKNFEEVFSLFLNDVLKDYAYPNETYSLYFRQWGLLRLSDEQFTAIQKGTS